ncbi:hypothetical protein GCM10028895_07580 [Pontibacter rugosus]
MLNDFKRVSSAKLAKHLKAQCFVTYKAVIIACDAWSRESLLLQKSMSNIYSLIGTVAGFVDRKYRFVEINLI